MLYTISCTKYSAFQRAITHHIISSPRQVIMVFTKPFITRHRVTVGGQKKFFLFRKKVRFEEKVVKLENFELGQSYQQSNWTSIGWGWPQKCWDSGGKSRHAEHRHRFWAFSFFSEENKRRNFLQKKIRASSWPTDREIYHTPKYKVQYRNPGIVSKPEICILAFFNRSFILVYILVEFRL